MLKTATKAVVVISTTGSNKQTKKKTKKNIVLKQNRIIRDKYD